MHTTIVKFKNGKTAQGILGKSRPAEGYFTLIYQDDELRIELKDILSADTEGERRGQSGDELARARRYMQQARQFGWDGITPNTPLMEWEKT